jgi:hypothetical protein
MPDIPNVSKWKELYKLHGAPDGGVTKALESYWASGANTPKTYLVAYTNLEKALAAYITKVNKDAKLKKKITEYATFEKTFLDKYLAAAHVNRADTERGMAGVATYKAEVVKFMAMVQKLSQTKATALDISRFKSGPARGLSAMASQARGLNAEQVKTVNAIRDEVKKVDGIVDKMPATTTQEQRNGYVTQILAIAEAIRKLAKAGGMA